MNPTLLKNWFRSIEHQYGAMKCNALACYFVHRALLVNHETLQPADIINIQRLVNVFNKFYEGQTITANELRFVTEFERLSAHQNFDFTAGTNTILAAHYVARAFLGYEHSAPPSMDSVAPWERSVMFSADALNITPVQTLISAVEEIMEHME